MFLKDACASVMKYEIDVEKMSNILDKLVKEKFGTPILRTSGKHYYSGLLFEVYVDKNLPHEDRKKLIRSLMPFLKKLFKKEFPDEDLNIGNTCKWFSHDAEGRGYSILFSKSYILRDPSNTIQREIRQKMIENQEGAND